MADYSKKFPQNTDDELDDETLLLIYQELIDQGFNTDKTPSEMLNEFKQSKLNYDVEHVDKMGKEERWSREKELEKEFKNRSDKPSPGSLSNGKDAMWEAVRANGGNILANEGTVKEQVESWLAERQNSLVGRDKASKGKDPYDVYPLD